MAGNAAEADRTRDFILGLVASLKPEDYAFAVEAYGPPWDVYRFKHAGGNGMLALRLVNGQAEIGFCRKGEWTPDDARRELLNAES